MSASQLSKVSVPVKMAPGVRRGLCCEGDRNIFVDQHEVMRSLTILTAWREHRNEWNFPTGIRRSHKSATGYGSPAGFSGFAGRKNLFDSFTAVRRVVMRTSNVIR